MLHISTFIEDGLLEVYLDDNLVIRGSGELKLHLDRNKKFELKWIVNSRPSINFRVSLFEPSHLGFSHVKLVGTEGKEKEKIILQT